MCLWCNSEHLPVSGLHVRRYSFSSASKQASDLLGKDGADSEPDRDIELELSALDMEDIETQDCKPEVGTPNPWSVRLRLVLWLLSVVLCCLKEALYTQRCSDKSHPSTAFSTYGSQLPDRMDAHLMKKMAFR